MLCLAVPLCIRCGFYCYKCLNVGVQVYVHTVHVTQGYVNQMVPVFS